MIPKTIQGQYAVQRAKGLSDPEVWHALEGKLMGRIPDMLKDMARTEWDFACRQHCPNCNGNLISDDDRVFCLQCGREPTAELTLNPNKTPRYTKGK